MTVKTSDGYGDHRTDDWMVIQSGLNITLTAGSYLEYDIRAAQSTYMRGSVQFYYYDPSTQQYAYSSNLTYQDQNGVSNKWDTDLNSRYYNTWYHRVLPLQSLQGKIIKKVFFLTDDQPSTTGPQTYSFYCDEVKIDGQDIGKANGNSFSPTAFYENFNDGNIHDGNPVEWYTTGSYWTVSNGNLFWNSVASTSGQCSNPELTFDDFEASFDLKADGYYSTSHWAAFAFRKANYDHSYTSSGYMVYYRYNGQICLYKAGAGDIATANTGKNLSAWRKVKIVAYGSSIKVYVDEVLQINATDNTYTQGYFGLNVFGVSARYDNLTIDGNPFENEIYYIRDIEGNVIAEYDGGGNLLAEYVYGNGQRLGKINPDGTVDYYMNDHLGSARTMVGSGWSANYYPFGEIASQTGSNEDTRFDFTGQERDRGTGLIYFGARYYDSSLGRWMSVDPLANGTPDMTSYHFTHNNPVNRKDSDGQRDDWNSFVPKEEIQKASQHNFSVTNIKKELIVASEVAPQGLDIMSSASNLLTLIPGPQSPAFFCIGTLLKSQSVVLKIVNQKETGNNNVGDITGDIMGYGVGLISSPVPGEITDLTVDYMTNSLSSTEKTDKKYSIHRQDVIQESLLRSVAKAKEEKEKKND
jgi:RHS repeat-associated protein